MSARVCIGGQWGDEAKGNLLAHLAHDADYIVRYDSGPGTRTVDRDDVSFRLRVLPTGVLQPQTTSVISDGAFIEPELLRQELERLSASNLEPTSDSLVIDPGVQIVMPYHKAVAIASGSVPRVGGREVVPDGVTVAMEYRSSGVGLRVSDLFNLERLKEKVRAQVFRANSVLAAFGKNVVSGKDIEAMLKRLERFASLLKPFVRPSAHLLQEALRSNKNVLCEGSGGAFIDRDIHEGSEINNFAHRAGVAGLIPGIGCTGVQSIVMVAKSYLTRMGKGPFPSEIQGPEVDVIRRVGVESSTRHSVDRRVGWLDLVMLRRAALLHGATELAITKLDVLAQLGDAAICVDYRSGEQRVTGASFDMVELDDVSPETQRVSGLSEIQDAHLKSSRAQWPKGLETFIATVENHVGLPVTLIGFGRKIYPVV